MPPNPRPLWPVLLLAVVCRRHQALIDELAYVRAEADYCRSLVPPGRRPFTDTWRRTLADLGHRVGWQRLGEIATVAHLKTMQKWYRVIVCGGVVAARKRMGRPKVPQATERLVVRMAKDNPSWGQMRIRGELMKVGMTVAARTIATILKRNGLPTRPHRPNQRRWQPFVLGNLDEIVATDFFTTKIWTLLGVKEVHVLFFIHLGGRRVHIAGVTDHPNEAFMVQTARNMTGLGGWLEEVGARHIIHDRDAKYCAAWQGVIGDGLSLVPTSYSAPNMNAYAERWVHSVKSECLDRLTIFGISGLRRVLREYVAHYHAERPHQGLGNALIEVDVAAQKLDSMEMAAEIVRLSRLGGLLSSYQRAA